LVDQELVDSRTGTVKNPRPRKLGSNARAAFCRAYRNHIITNRFTGILTVLVGRVDKIIFAGHWFITQVQHSKTTQAGVSRGQSATTRCGVQHSLRVHVRANYPHGVKACQKRPVLVRIVPMRRCNLAMHVLQ